MDLGHGRGDPDAIGRFAGDVSSAIGIVLLDISSPEILSREERHRPPPYSHREARQDAILQDLGNHEGNGHERADDSAERE